MLKNTCVANLKGQPEAFLILERNPDSGGLQKTGPLVGEREMRVHLTSHGLTQAEIDLAIENAKANPV
jgi:hypothetical protein